MHAFRWTGRNAVAVGLLLGLVTNDGRASAQQELEIRSGGRAAQGRTCTSAVVTNALPDVATIVDVERLKGVLAAELVTAPSGGELHFSIRFTREGHLEWTERLRRGTEPASHPGIERLIAEHLKPQKRSAEPWSLRLQILPSDSLQVRLAHSEVCLVERVPDRAGPIGSSLGLMNREDLADLQRAGPVEVAVNVSPLGNVISVELVRRSGSRIVDDEALNTARESDYRPALVDGIPVAGRYVYGSRTRVRVRTQRVND